MSDENRSEQETRDLTLSNRSRFDGDDPKPISDQQASEHASVPSPNMPDQAQTPMMPLENALLAMLKIPNGNLVALKFLISDDAYRKRVLKHMKDPVIRSYWQSAGQPSPDHPGKTAHMANRPVCTLRHIFQQTQHKMNNSPAPPIL